MRSIFKRYWLIISLLVGGMLFVAGALDLVLSYRENVELVSSIQQVEASAAGARIEGFLHSIEKQVDEAASLPWTSGVMSIDDQRTELHRLLKLVPAILELRLVKSGGRQWLYVSRLNPDQLGEKEALMPDWYHLESAAYGPTYFRDGSAPFTSLAVRLGGTDSRAYAMAEVNLSFAADVVGAKRIGVAGKAYIVDRAGRLIAHPNLSLVFNNIDLSQAEQVRSTRALSGAPGQMGAPSMWTKGVEGGAVLISAVPVGKTGWTLFVEQPASEVLAPVWSAAYRALAILLAGLAVSFAASRVLARSLTQPILRVRENAARIGAGDLAARIDIKSGDELESLADEFNRMAAQLQEYAAGLEEKVKTRTRELSLALAEIDTKRLEAERANVAKTRFLAAASHDLRQPMHAISLLVGILDERSRQSDLSPLVAKVQMSVRAMENLFNGLLDISKLDAGTIRPAVSQFNLGELLRLVELNFSPLAKEKGLSLRVVQSRAIVESDPALVERVVNNLVSNAIRYTEAGRILVGCRRRADTIRLLVIDTGIGIAPEHMDDIFEEFFQVSNLERDRSKGLGLGLSIVKRSADLLGHRLLVSSIPGRGSTFGLELPLAAGRSFAAPTEREAESPTGDLHNTFVVIIDDDADNRFATEAQCLQWGCHVVSTGSGEEALEKLAGHLRPPDLIICDYRLRDGETGTTTIDRIRSQAEVSIPAIIVTGDFAGVDRQAIEGTGIVTLHKPVSPDAIRRSAEALLAASRRKPPA